MEMFEELLAFIQAFIDALLSGDWDAIDALF